MALDSIAQRVLDAVNALPPPETVGVEAARRHNVEMTRRAPRGPEVHRVEDRSARCGSVELPVRIYTPAGAGPFPVVVYFHGGGFVLGDLDTGDAHCRMFCAGAECVVVSVNYRHAPEHRFPAAAEDASAAVRWAAENAAAFRGDAQRLAVAGASSGATLAAVAALDARDRGAPRIGHQLLLVPVTDMRHEYPSFREYASGFALTRNTMRWFGQQYFNDMAELDLPHASPLRAASHTGLPAASIFTAECDPLRDEGAAYARKLEAAGVRVKLKCYAGFIHVRLGPEADADMVAALREWAQPAHRSTRHCDSSSSSSR